MDELSKRLGEAIKHFWLTRSTQAERQGLKSGQRDAGLRTAVTGGKHLDGFIKLCRELLIEAGLQDLHVFWAKQLELPGYYRPEKRWDLVVVAEGQLVAVIEFKAQVGPSFGNNFNNRTEEALGNATDLWAAYREGAFKPSIRPWLGFVFILEDCPASRRPLSVKHTHFPAFREFENTSYADRYGILLTRLLRDRLYDGAALILSTKEGGSRGEFSSLSDELSFANFIAGMQGVAAARARQLDPKRGESTST